MLLKSQDSQPDHPEWSNHHDDGKALAGLFDTTKRTGIIGAAAFILGNSIGSPCVNALIWLR